MKFIKSLLIFISAVLILSSANKVAFAGDFAVIDVNKVVQNYNKSQNANIDFKVRKADLENFVAKARKDIQQTKTPEAKKKLETKYNSELKQKNLQIKQDQTKIIQEVQSDIYNAISSVVAKNKISVVFNKESVIFGAEDITDQIISYLNSQTK